jgi:hypothetical protein
MDSVMRKAEEKSICEVLQSCVGVAACLETVNRSRGTQVGSGTRKGYGYNR